MGWTDNRRPATNAAIKRLHTTLRCDREMDRRANRGATNFDSSHFTVNLQVTSQSATVAVKSKDQLSWMLQKMRERRTIIIFSFRLMDDRRPGLALISRFRQASSEFSRNRTNIGIEITTFLCSAVSPTPCLYRLQPPRYFQWPFTDECKEYNISLAWKHALKDAIYQ